MHKFNLSTWHVLANYASRSPDFESTPPLVCFVKHQVFARMSRLDKNEITGNGNEVQRILEEVATEYPDVSRALIPQ